MINGALQIYDRDAVERLRGLFNAVWARGAVIKDGPVLTDARQQQLLTKYEALMQELLLTDPLVPVGGIYACTCAR